MRSPTWPSTSTPSSAASCAWRRCSVSAFPLQHLGAAPNRCFPTGEGRTCVENAAFGAFLLKNRPFPPAFPVQPPSGSPFSPQNLVWFPRFLPEINNFHGMKKSTKKKNHEILGFSPQNTEIPSFPPNPMRSFQLLPKITSFSARPRRISPFSPQIDPKSSKFPPKCFPVPKSHLFPPKDFSRPWMGTKTVSSPSDSCRWGAFRGIWGHFGAFGGTLGSFCRHLGPFGDYLGIIWGSSGVTLGSVYILGAVTGSFQAI